MAKRAVILAGGIGSRLYPYTLVFPKPLMPIGEKPILEIVIQQLAYFGFTQITFAVGHLASLIQAYFGSGEKWGVEIDYSYETQPLGTAAPISLVDNLTTDFLVMNGDILCSLNYAEMMDYHLAHGALATIGTYPKRVDIDLGVLHINQAQEITEYIEKPTKTYDVSMGIYCFKPEILDFIPQDQRFDLPDLMLKLIGLGKMPKAYPFQEYWLDIGRQQDYAEAQEVFLKNTSAFHIP